MTIHQRPAHSSIKRVIFVCMGNICRSPAGEGVLNKQIEEADLSDAIEVDSAGTIAYHVGESADPRMRETAKHRGYSLDSRARQFRKEDFEDFDLIVAMDRKNLADIQALDATKSYREKVRLFSSFIENADEDWPQDVPDPYYGGPAGFEKVLDMIEAGAPTILDALRP